MYTSRIARGKVPEYPRPVPDIDVDEIPICEDTIVYEQWTDDGETHADERAKKRQKRRQEVAETYLRGGEIMILTASLKGPFEGWKNPWAKKRQRGAEKSGLEVPETTVRNTRPRFMRPLEAVKGSENDPIDLEDNEALPIDVSDSKDQPPNPFNAKNQAARITLGEQEPSSTKRVEDWLKTSDVYSRRPRSNPGSFPTPASRPPTRDRQSPRATTSPIRAKPSHQPDVQGQKVPMLGTNKDAPSSRPGTASSAPTHESPRRAEAAILEAKRKSLQVVPPSTNLPAFEYRRCRRDDKKASANQRLSGDPKPKDAESPRVSEPPKEPENGTSNGKDKSMSKPVLSTETSKTSTVHNIPSAQAPAPNLEPVVSNAQSTNDLLQELPSASRSEVQVAQPATTRPGGQEADGDEQDVSGRKPDNATFGKLQGTNTADVVAPVPSLDTPVRELETQEMIAAIKPFDFSTIKKPQAPLTRPSPATATKVKPTKSGKRASFAVEHPTSDDSQTSIKAGLKVKKAGMATHVEKSRVKVGLFEEKTAATGPESEQVNADFLNESLPSLSSMFGGRRNSAPKSILKSSNAISSAPAPSGNTTSTSMKQDAQMPSEQPGQNGINVDLMNEDDNFDLDAAIDDLGSYLGTWDAEEEAARVAAAK